MPVKISIQSCIGCQACFNMCPVKAFSYVDNRPVFSRPQNCVGCGHCYAICPVEAISIFEKAASTEILESPDKVLGAIRFRRSIRRFIPRPLPKELIQKLIDVTKFCPSADNQRLIKYIVLSRQAINRISDEIVRTCQAQFPGIQKLQPKFDFLFRGAQHCIINYGDIDMVTAVQEGAIQITTLELFAQNVGVGCVWIGYLTKACKANPYLLDMLGLDSQKQKVLSCLGIGYPAMKYKRSVARQDEKIEFME